MQGTADPSASQSFLLGRINPESVGRICGAKGGMLTARIPFASLGDLCYVSSTTNEIPALVVGFQENYLTLAPLQHIDGVSIGAKVHCTGESPTIQIPANPAGRIFDALGNPVSCTKYHHGTPESCVKIPLFAQPPDPLSRRTISEQLCTGITAIDLFCPIGHGQRLGLFASAGIGKSTLMGMIARNAEVDAVVIALVGERGREVRDFIDDTLGNDGLERSVIVVSTSDEPAIRRTLATYTATAIAERYRGQGKKVLLLIDSITRAARAMRDVGLCAGELPVRHGFPPSVFGELPKLLERSGNDPTGSITAIYNVLTDNERELDPLAEEIKSILDGHIILSRKISESGVLPPLDLVKSVSRLAHKITNTEVINSAHRIKRLSSRLQNDKDLMLMGGTPDPELSVALRLESQINKLICQSPCEKRSYVSSRELLMKMELD